MKTNKQKGSIEIWLWIIIVAFSIVVIHTINQYDISRLEKSDKCFENLLVKKYDINYETDKINTHMSECMSLKD